MFSGGLSRADDDDDDDEIFVKSSYTDFLPFRGVSKQVGPPSNPLGTLEIPISQYPHILSCVFLQYKIALCHNLELKDANSQTKSLFKNHPVHENLFSEVPQSRLGVFVTSQLGRANMSLCQPVNFLLQKKSDKSIQE